MTVRGLDRRRRVAMRCVEDALSPYGAVSVSAYDGEVRHGDRTVGRNVRILVDIDLSTMTQVSTLTDVATQAVEDANAGLSNPYTEMSRTVGQPGEPLVVSFVIDTIAEVPFDG